VLTCDFSFLTRYGFHKVPHMQQGVLEPNSSSELWEFTNPNFQRDQQHLLPLVTRKKALHPTIEHPDGAGGSGGDDGASGSGSGGAKGVDVPGILNSTSRSSSSRTNTSGQRPLPRESVTSSTRTRRTAYSASWRASSARVRRATLPRV
jgi:hypothetical protein